MNDSHFQETALLKPKELEPTLPHLPTAGGCGAPVRVGATVLVVICVLLAVSGCRKATAATQGFVYVSNGKSDTVTVIDTATFAPLRTLNVGKNPTGVTPNPVNGEVYVVNSDSGSVSVIDARSNQLLATMAVQRNPYYLAVTPDGTRAF
jgi:YVTN family beta-propeller protein